MFDIKHLIWFPGHVIRFQSHFNDILWKGPENLSATLFLCLILKITLCEMNRGRLDIYGEGSQYSQFYEFQRYTTGLFWSFISTDC